jgi:predicted nucleic acid-binding protein
VVIDASAVVDLVTKSSREGRIAFAIRGRALAAPQIVFLEVVHACRRMLRAGDLTPTAAERAIAELALLDLTAHDHLPLMPRVWQLRDRCTAYDAAYVALAERLGRPLLTTDARLTRAIGSLLPVVALGRGSAR